MFKALSLVSRIMNRLAASIVCAVLFAAVPAAAAPGDAQGEMRRDVRVGKVKKPSEIEALILPTMRGAQYLGPEYDPAAMAYRLKFIRDGRVMFVDVDARTGAVIRRSQ